MIPKNADVGGISPHSTGRREREKRTADPTKEARPGITRRDATRDILDGEERDEAGLETEPDAAGQRVERGHGLEHGDERGERDEHGDEHVHEHRCRGRVGPLEQVVQVKAPRGGNARARWRDVHGRGSGIVMMSVSMSVLFVFVLLVPVPIIIIIFLPRPFLIGDDGWATAHCGLVGEEDVAVARIPGVEKGECVEGDVSRPSGSHLY